MIILSAATDILEVTLGGAITTNQARVVASWRDITTTAFTPGRTVGLTNNATPVSAAGSPAASTQRVVDLLNVYNSDTVAATVTIQFYDGSVRYVLWSGSLATLESVQYVEGAGWCKVSASGAPLAGSISAVNGTTAEITASTTAGVVTLSLPTALTFTGKTVNGGTFASPTLTTPALGTPTSGTLTNTTGFPAASLAGTALPAAIVTSSITTVGALNSGSITPGFGSIDVGADSITGGIGTFSGDVTIGPGGSGAALTNLVVNGSDANNYGPLLTFKRAGVAKFYVGTADAALGAGDDEGAVLATTAFNIGINGSGTVGKFTSTGINSTVIGATTPAAGSFTTLSATGAIKLGNAYVAGAVVPTGTLTLQDSTGTTYRIPCLV